MPFKDKEQKKKWQGTWKETRPPSYHKWLYAKRRLRYWRADTCEDALNDVANLLKDEKHVEALDLVIEVLALVELEKSRIPDKFPYHPPTGWDPKAPRKWKRVTNG